MRSRANTVATTNLPFFGTLCRCLKEAGMCLTFHVMTLKVSCSGIVFVFPVVLIITWPSISICKNTELGSHKVILTVIDYLLYCFYTITVFSNAKFGGILFVTLKGKN